MIAYVREVPDAINECELTYLEREPIDVAEARRHHAEYVELLVRLGVEVRFLPATHDLPDSVFVEDTAVVFPEVAVITRPGAESRQPEVDSSASALSRHRSCVQIEAPHTIDGGDVTVVGKRVFVGLSTRSTADGVEAMRSILEPLGYSVDGVEVNGVLHLKSAATAISDDAVLLNPDYVDPAVFDGLTVVKVDPTEPDGANVVLVGDQLIHGAEYPKTTERLRAVGYTVHTVPSSEIAKAEGAVTCCSLLVTT